MWDNSADDNIFFLAGAISFNLLLAAVPFVLLLATGLSYLLNLSAETASDEIVHLVRTLMPLAAEEAYAPIVAIVEGIIRQRGRVQLFSAIVFIWFSTRLFGSLRSVLAEVFDIEHERSIIGGKLFDIKITLVATVLLVGYTVLSAYLAFATTRGIVVLSELGIRQDLMGGVEYWIGRLLGFLSITVLFFALYKFLPLRRIRWHMAMVGALFGAFMFEIARQVFTVVMGQFAVRSIYTGTVAAAIIVVIWVYYGSLIFILGGELGQVYELRRMRRLQREAFWD
jgi:membrane protein